jgi:hypothetical protein
MACVFLQRNLIGLENLDLGQGFREARWLRAGFGGGFMDR